MDENSENIISVCNGNKEIADEAFVELMSLTEKCLNDKAKSNQDKYKNCGGKAMENEAAKAMIEVAPSTPFRNAKIEVVSGARFPDIQAGVYYGVEVKTTKGNKWKSVGSSIVESTRIKEVSMIYMLFGKLGGEFAEFRCKPYEDCLDNISLTHQPRYQIDMELEEKQQATIFQKMKTDYNAFRLYDEKEKIQKVRQYFRSTAKEGKEMSWWIGEEDMMQIRAANFKGTMACVGKTSEEMSFNWMILCEDVSLLVDNAYYNPGDNSMTILPIYLMEPYYSKEYSDAFNYSTLASTLGHEMTHALDVNGSMFDAYGNYRNWWTVADKMEFKDRQQKLIDCINMLEIMPNELPNVFADGEMTLSENTADLGGFLIGLQAYVEKLKREGYYGEEMTKQERKFYQAYAEQWRAKYTPKYALRRRKDDVHSLAKERVNGTVMNTDRWYELFDVKFGNILYLTPETRARIW